MGEVVVPLQHVKARAVVVGNLMIILVEDGGDNGAKLAQAGEEFLFEFRRLRGEVLYTKVDQVSLPKLSRAASTDLGRALEDTHADARRLQGLAATKAGKTGADDCNRAKLFFHRGNLGGVYKLGQGRSGFSVDF